MRQSVDHAIELKKIVQKFKEATGAEKINIVAHSKGGLDARVYLANNLSSSDVANLIMIGTPNKGSIMANLFGGFDFCKPAVFDLMTNSQILNVPKEFPYSILYHCRKLAASFFGTCHFTKYGLIKIALLLFGVF